MSEQDVAALNDQAMTLFNEGNLAEAISTWQRVLALDPTHEEARRGLDLAQQKMALTPPPASDPSGGGGGGGTFGEIDAGNVESIGLPVSEAEVSDDDASRREEQIAAEMAARYGKSDSGGAQPATPTSSSFTMAPAEKSTPFPWKLLIPVVAVVALAFGGFYAYLTVFASNSDDPSLQVEVTPPEPERTPEQWTELYETTLADARAALSRGELSAADELVQEARGAAGEAGLADTAALDAFEEELRAEQAWEAGYRRAVRAFCQGDYGSMGLDELADSKPADGRPADLMATALYNMAVENLQQLQPWEAIWPLEQVGERLRDAPPSADPEGRERLRRDAADLRAFAAGFRRGTELSRNYDYTSRVDRLSTRQGVCAGS